MRHIADHFWMASSLHFAPENPEDGEMYILIPAHPGCPGQSPESCKMVVCFIYNNMATVSHSLIDK